MGKLISQIGENLSFVLECLGVFAATSKSALSALRLRQKTFELCRRGLVMT